MNLSESNLGGTDESLQCYHGSMLYHGGCSYHATAIAMVVHNNSAILSYPHTSCFEFHCHHRC